MKKYVLFVIITLSVITAFMVTYNLCYNFGLYRSYNENTERYKYTDAINKNSIDLNNISDLFPDAYAPIGVIASEDSIKSPIKINYYKNINDKAPIYSIEKGEIIQFEAFPKLKSELKFRGNDSLPTNTQGWRLAKPFIVNGKENNALLYVKLEDLFCVTYEWLKENPKLAEAYSADVMRMKIFPTKYNVSKYMLLFVDRELYSEGIFCSKDIFKPIFNSVIVINMLIIIILLVLYIFKINRS